MVSPHWTVVTNPEVWAGFASFIISELQCLTSYLVSVLIY